MARVTTTRERTKRRRLPSHQRPHEASPPASGATLWERLSLKLLVFCAGGVLMGLEIAGSRVLAPHFGSSVFVWGSLISVFLIALSLGYYFGGLIADRHPSRVLLDYVFVVTSLWIFGIAVLAHGLCELLVKAGATEQAGPLAASLLLFLPPSVGLGMVSPLAIRLATQSVRSVGRISGTLYAISTIGSVAGTLLTTFVLIPMVGISAILKGLAFLLLAASLLKFVPPWTRKRGVTAHHGLSAVAVACLFVPPSPGIALGPQYEVVAEVDTPYHRVSVIDHNSYNCREMRFDQYYAESAVVKSPPYPGACSYTNYFHLAFLAHPDIERSLFIGAGGGVGPRAFQMHNSAMEIDVVDVDPKVLELSRKYFYLEDTPKIRTIAADGRMFVRDAKHPYDCVVLDAFTAGARIPPHLATREFVQICHDKMSDDGVFVINIISAVDGPISPIFHSMYRTLESVFPNTYVFAKDYRDRGKTNSTNIILLATKAKPPIPPAQWTIGAEQHHTLSYVTRSEMKRMVGDLLVNSPDVSDAPIFTDDYCPIDTMPFQTPGRRRELLLRALGSQG